MTPVRRWEPGAIQVHWDGNDLMDLVLDIRDLANSRKWKVGGASKRSMFADMAEIAALAEGIFWNNRPTHRNLDHVRELGQKARGKYE